MRDETPGNEKNRRQSLEQQLVDLKVGGVILQMTRAGQIVEVRCEMPTCFNYRGRKRFEEKRVPPSDWQLTPDHYPRLKADGGHLEPGNVRLAHRLCNLVDYGWRLKIRTMMAKGLSLETIAGKLNAKKRVQAPPGNNKWSAITVRKAFVS